MKPRTFRRPTKVLSGELACRVAVLVLTLFCSAATVRATTYDVPPGASLQYYIDVAQYGDTIQLQPGQAYVGPVTLRYKTYAEPYRTDYITIVTAGAYQNFPRGARVSPANAGAMAKIVSPGGGEPAVKTEPGAHHYRFVGVEFTFVNGNPCNYSPEQLGSTPCVYGLVILGGSAQDQDTSAEVPHHFELDRCYVHGLPGVYLKRGIELNSAFTDVVNSYVSECHVQGQDAQAIGGWNGPGPYSIINNYLEGSG